MLNYWFVIGIGIGAAYDLVVGSLYGKYPNSKIIAFKTKNLHIHHSFWGLGLIVLYFIFKIDLLLGAAIGGILTHSIRHKSFLFIEYKGKRYF